MPVPSSISQLSQTAGSNSPAGSESPNTVDDYLRTYASYIAMHRDGAGFSQEATVASAATADIGVVASMFVQITGTTTITSFGANYNGPRFVRFAGALTLTHNATTLILPGGANIATAAGDCALVVPVGNPATGWQVVAYQFASLTTPVARGGTGATDAATARTNLGVAALAVAQTFSGAQRGSVTALTDGATITPDFALGNNFSVTLGGNRTLANPSNQAAGQSGVIVITQDATGSRTLAFGSNWKFANGTAPSLTTTANAVDVLAYYVESATRITARLISDVK